MATDSGADTAAHTLVAGECRAHAAPLSRAGGVLDERSRKKRARSDAGGQPSPWACIQPDVLGVVLGFLPCLADRASVWSVCRHWRAAAHDHVLPPLLPVLVLPKLRFSCLCSSGARSAMRCTWRPEGVATDDVRFMGSFHGWLVGVAPSKDRSMYFRGADGECFLVKVDPFSRKVLRLPQLSTFHQFAACSRKALPVINGSGEVHFTMNDIYRMSIRKVVLSASPDSGSKYIVAASSYHTVSQTLALWQPGMMSWNTCEGVPLAGPKDLAFYQGKLYVLSRFMPRLLAFDLQEDDRAVIVSRVEQCATEPILGHQPVGALSCNMVVWRGKLLIIVRRYDQSCTLRALRKVEVFALDMSRNPYGLTKIRSLDGDCIFVDSCNCHSFHGGLHDGVEGDLIYFVDQYSKYDDSGFNPSYDTFVYNMRDGTARPFAVELSPRNFGAPNGKLTVPLWLLPSQ
ncbi:hypothetical protein ACP70R_007450 [Stipagrostis hirtigluma subsp. patula]